MHALYTCFWFCAFQATFTTGYCTILSVFSSRFCCTEGRILPVIALFLIALLCFCKNFHFDAWFHLQFCTLSDKMEYLSAWFTSIGSCLNYGVLTLFEIENFQISVCACKLSLWMSPCYCCCCFFIYFFVMRNSSIVVNFMAAKIPSGNILLCFYVPFAVLVSQSLYFIKT